mgnify:CR=1 FL=1
MPALFEKFADKPPFLNRYIAHMTSENVFGNFAVTGNAAQHTE